MMGESDQNCFVTIVGQGKSIFSLGELPFFIVEERPWMVHGSDTSFQAPVDPIPSFLNPSNDY